MRQSLPAILDAITAAGVRDRDGFPLRATMAAIAQAEGADPNAWVEHDPPTSRNAPPASGLYQVHRGSWPKIYADTERIRHARISDRDKMIAMTVLVEPIIEDAYRTAVTTAQTLGRRGIVTTFFDWALFMDATWQAGSPHLAEWAQRTRRGDARTIVNPPRAIRVEVALRKLAADELGVAPGMGVAVGVLFALGLAAWALSQWET